MGSPDRCIVAPGAFVGFSPKVKFHMSRQIGFLNRGIGALIAFERYYSRVSFYMSLQMARMNRCIVALVAFVRFFPRVSFQTCFSAACQKGISNMDSFWTISGFFGPPELFLEVSLGFKIFNQKS